MQRNELWFAVVTFAVAGGIVAGVQFMQPALGAPSPVKLTAKEFAYVPKTITVSPGTATVAMTNAGQIEHTFVIDALKVNSGLIKPGKSATITLKNLKPGTYQFYCDVPGHKDLGMIGTLTVK